MVYDRAHELAAALARCDEYKRLEIAKAGIANDSTAKRMIKDFLTRKMELEFAAMSGKERDQKAMAALEQLAGVISANPRARDYLEAYGRFQVLMNDVSRILSEAVKQGMDIVE